MKDRFQTTTAGMLIEELKNLDPDTPVAFASDYGDYTHTMQVHEIKGRLEKVLLERSGYSRSGFAINEDFEPQRDTDEPDPAEFPPDDPPQTVFIIK
jgi:hypothetical protein